LLVRGKLGVWIFIFIADRGPLNGVEHAVITLQADLLRRLDFDFNGAIVDSFSSSSSVKRLLLLASSVR
jgi:hypothetical protein